MQEQELVRKAKAAYMRDWRKKNPEKVKANNQRYWAKRGLELQNKEEEVCRKCER